METVKSEKFLFIAQASKAKEAEAPHLSASEEDEYV